jgi:uncharacterized protein (DUF1330 family)
MKTIIKNISLVILFVTGITTTSMAQKNGGYKKTKEVDGTKLQVVYSDLIINSSTDKVWNAVAEEFVHIDKINETISESECLSGDKTTGVGASRHCTLEAFGRDMEVSEKIISWIDTHLNREFTYEVYDFVNFPMKKMQITWGVKSNDKGQTILYGISAYRMKMGMMSGMMRGKMKKGMNDNIYAIANYVENGERNIKPEVLRDRFKTRNADGITHHKTTTLKTESQEPVLVASENDEDVNLVATADDAEMPMIDNHAFVDKSIEKQEANYALFQKGKLIEVAFMSVKEGKQQQLNEKYFANVMPIAAEYGLRPLMTIGVSDTKSDSNINPQMVGFFEWPSKEKRAAFDKDPRFLKIKKYRDDALSFLKVGYFEVKEDKKVTLDNTLYYEVYAMNMDEKKGHLMKNYFDVAGPIVMNDYGVDFALSMTPVATDDKHVYTSQSFGIAIWKSKKDNETFFNSDEFNKIKHYRKAAVKRLDVWHGTAMVK